MQVRTVTAACRFFHGCTLTSRPLGQRCSNGFQNPEPFNAMSSRAMPTVYFIVKQAQKNPLEKWVSVAISPKTAYFRSLAVS